MDTTNPTIEAILVLTVDNLSRWKTQITAFFKLGTVKENILKGEPLLEEMDNTILCALLLTKYCGPPTAMVNLTNKNNALLIWKSIMKHFMPSELSNQAQVCNQLPNITFDWSNIENSFDNIKQSITHSKNGKNIKPKTLINHLKIHLNEQKVANASTSQNVTQASSVTGFINAENKFDILGHLEPHNIDITLYMGKKRNIGIMVLKVAHYLKFCCTNIEISS
ncbi:uncharacterized protein PGTG_05522 [Puccinia graminis f. sp. tritici CRL 75-36-700-3]|uniref:Uncharacterized protein n=1 Tax=Puccinia graminis f. sp. tritici (strain CRL 75-36-700-3 / race SCCL) TaxID=418459 RepID=E3K4N5_PUCGT|nr:uncharacterized protein PGTG_05522 [Puccinia graminis f. sp. tritici CRL 75-36-700-3]EFP79201.1 hypothetical protein PGTG_05522 [Puccinia graminis f. sp. tritici CRL 75-36-700-3]